MGVFVATFSAVAVTAAQDIFEIVAPANKRIRIYECVLGQYSDAGDAAAEILSVTILRGHTTAGSGGSSVTPSNVSGLTNAEVATATVNSNNTGLATGGSPATVRAEAWNVQGPWLFNSDSNFLIEAGQRMVFRISGPSDSLTMNGTLVFEEIAA